MTTDERFDAAISTWFEETPGRLPERVLSATFERTRRSRQQVGWLELLARRGKPRFVPALGGAVVVVLAAAVALNFYLNQRAISGPVVQPRNPIEGTWVNTTDADRGTQTMTVRASADNTMEIRVLDDVATVCSGTSSTMTGTGRLEDSTTVVIPSPVYTCDDGSEAKAVSGPPLAEQLRNLTFVYHPETDTLTTGADFSLVWRREGAPDVNPAPATPTAMWPQSSLDEVRKAQELADAGDPNYAWQVDQVLASDEELASNANLYPWNSEVVQRFLRERLGWEAWGIGRSGVFAGSAGGPYDEVMLIRCAPGRTNPLYPEMPSDVRGCAPTIDDFRYETVRIDLEQPGRRGPSGIWVVTGWELLQPVEPGTFYEHLYPDYELRQVVQVAPPSDAEVTALLQAFLGARVDGEGAEQYIHRHPDGWDDREAPILYATTGGSPYERYEIDRLQGPVWPTGWIELRLRLFAEDGTVVEQSFVVVRQEDGRLGLMYGLPFETDLFATTENGQPVPVPYKILDDEVTFAAAPPWDVTAHDRTSTILGGVGRGSAAQFTMFMVTADPRTGMGCDGGPPAADVDSLVQSIRSNPGLEATAPIAASVGGLDALRMDVVAPGIPQVGDCSPRVLGDFWLPQGSGRMRLYLLDLPEGMSARTLAIAISALDSEFDDVVDAAEPILDSFEFHAR